MNNPGLFLPDGPGMGLEINEEAVERLKLIEQKDHFTSTLFQVNFSWV